MAAGRAHDRACRWLALPYGLLWWPWLGPPGVLVSSLAFLIGGLWLSPDLDTRSNPSRRWGPLRILWWPYRRLLSHRSVLSHTPLLGSAGRLLYLAALLLALAAVSHGLGIADLSQLPAALKQIWRTQRPLALAALVGVEASAWLHLIQDGDPMPRRPRRRRRHQ